MTRMRFPVTALIPALIPALPALVLLAGALLPTVLQAAPVLTDEVEVELIAENTALHPGQNWVALRLRPQPGWHTYWRNPGDSGIPTKLQWTLPPDLSAGPIQWPLPHAETLGDLTNYGYSRETLHLVPITVAAGAGPGPLHLAARASWLACKDICVPGEAQLSLDLPLAPTAKANPIWADAFARARRALPQDAPDASARFAIADGSLSLQIDHPPGIESDDDTLNFFPINPELVNHAAAQRIARGADSLRLSQALSEYYTEPPSQLDGVLVVVHDGRERAWRISAGPGAVTPVAGAAPARADATATEPSLRPTPTGTTDDGAPAVAPMSLALVLGLALLGGLVLNLMPCVFPVLSLKAMALISHGQTGNGHERRRQIYAYSAGVILSCTAIAVSILGLRSAGAAVGWGFQLQSPAFVGLMAYVMFALGLSMSGVAHFGMGLTNIGGALAQRSGLTGSFFTGVLAVVVASPCTAPFMGSAMGYAMTQPPQVALLVFATLGLGLALPFLLIGWFPPLARLLPRPGAWMDNFKQFMAFPLYLSVVWLLWVLARQTDPQVLGRVMLGLVAIAFALWLWHRSGPLAASLRLAALAVALGLVLTAPAGRSSEVTAATANRDVWSAQRLAELRADKRTIFVDFTADWCLSCKVNERLTLRSSRVQQAFQDRNVVTLVGDWSRSDPAITAELARFGRNGVPLYLVYVRGGEPKVLPQLLTADTVIDALD